MAERIQLALVIKTMSRWIIFLWLYQYVSLQILCLKSAPDGQKGILVVHEHDAYCVLT